MVNESFVGIDEQDPVLGGLRVSESLLITVSRPVSLNDAFGILPANFDGSIRAERIHHHDLVAPAQAIEASADVLLLVETNHNSGDGRPPSGRVCLRSHDSQKIGARPEKIKL